MFGLSPTVEVDAWGDTLLRSLQAQGLPEVVSVVSFDASIDAKSRPGITKSLLSFMQYFVPSQTRVFDLSSSSDRLNALRALSEGRPGEPRWRDGRTWVLGEAAEWEDGVLKVTGIIRGAVLSANRLVHLPNFGDYQISKVCISFFCINSTKTPLNSRSYLLLCSVTMEKQTRWTLNQVFLQSLMQMKQIL